MKTLKNENAMETANDRKPDYFEDSNRKINEYFEFMYEIVLVSFVQQNNISNEGLQIKIF